LYLRSLHDQATEAPYILQNICALFKRARAIASQMQNYDVDRAQEWAKQLKALREDVKSRLREGSDTLVAIQALVELGLKDYEVHCKANVVKLLAFLAIFVYSKESMFEILTRSGCSANII